MATPAEKLAHALERMNAAQDGGIVRSDRLTRTYLSRLIRAGFLHLIVRGWYYVATPQTSLPGSTAWYGYYWEFVRQYLNRRFGDKYCLLPETSLRLLTGATAIPRQLALMHRSPGQQVLRLPLNTSLYIYQDKTAFPTRTSFADGIRVMDLSEALQRIPEAFFRSSPEDATIALRLLRGDTTILLRDLLENGRSAVAGRLAGAFRHIGEVQVADRILTTLKNAGYDVREQNPFVTVAAISNAPSFHLLSPYVSRLQSMWEKHREAVATVFSDALSGSHPAERLLDVIEEKYVQDAYHSLSIEGYRVSPELIEKVRRGNFDPARSGADRESADALAARGYLEAFRAVKESIGKIVDSQTTPAEILRRDHQEWYQALFSPAVRAGMMPVAALAGYRTTPVYISGSRHVPLPAHAVSDAIDALFTLIDSEENTAVRAVLGHFVFVFIHPYTDGNGRIARFLMNALFASGGMPWTIIRVENRSQYMATLETASVEGDLAPFARFLRTEMEAQV